MPEEIILELSWVVFHGFLSQMKSNLCEYFTSGAMQHNASYTIRLLVWFQKFLKEKILEQREKKVLEQREKIFYYI